MQYVLREDGRVFRWPVEINCAGEEEINIEPAILKSINVDIFRQVPGLAQIPQGKIGQSVFNKYGESFLSLSLSELSLDVPVVALPGEDKIFVPDFKNKKGAAVPLVWRVPEDMRLVWLARLRVSENSWTINRDEAWLFTFNSGHVQAYKLPLPNTYDDGHLCTGASFPVSAGNMLDYFVKGFETWSMAKWNTDLAPDGSNSNQLFRFKAAKEGFESLPPDGDWKDYCSKVGTGVLKHVVL